MNSKCESANSTRAWSNRAWSKSLVRFPSVSHWVLSAVLAVVGCTQDGQQRTDPAERISFQIPSDWQEAPGSNGTRFSPPGAGGRNVSINVNTGDMNPGVSLEKERDGWLAAQLSSGNEVLHSGEWSHNGFEGLEYSHTGKGMYGDIVWHHVLMSNGDYRVMGFMMASPDAYPEYRELFLQTMRSVTAR